MDGIMGIAVIIFLIFFVRQWMSISKRSNQIWDMAAKYQNAHLKKQQDYACNHCDAVLEHPDDISPNGDVKCKHCDQWFNVYQ